MKGSFVSDRCGVSNTLSTRGVLLKSVAAKHILQQLVTAGRLIRRSGGHCHILVNPASADILLTTNTTPLRLIIVLIQKRMSSFALF